MSPLMRKIHRWFAVAFTLAVIATTIALSLEEPILWMSYAPLLPLALLFLTGVYLFLLPYFRRRAGSAA